MCNSDIGFVIAQEEIWHRTTRGSAPRVLRPASFPQALAAAPPPPAPPRNPPAHPFLRASHPRPAAAANLHRPHRPPHAHRPTEPLRHPIPPPRILQAPPIHPMAQGAPGVPRAAPLAGLLPQPPRAARLPVVPRAHPPRRKASHRRHRAHEPPVDRTAPHAPRNRWRNRCHSRRRNHFPATPTWHHEMFPLHPLSDRPAL